VRKTERAAAPPGDETKLGFCYRSWTVLRAREVLSDCELALRDFEAAGPTPYWRTRWTALTALLRAVGHVLDKIDAARGGELKEAIAQAWAELNKTKPEPRIFWDFIEQERNNVLKIYEVGARLNTTLRPGTVYMSRSGQDWSGPSGPTTYEAFIQSGVYGGRDALEVCREAIAFWQRYLDRIETAAGLKSEPAV